MVFIITRCMLSKDFFFFFGYLFFTIPSKIPLIPKPPEICRSSTGPGSWNEIEKGPGGHRFWVCILKIWKFLHTIFSPVVDTPFIKILPSGLTSQLNLPAVAKSVIRTGSVINNAIRHSKLWLFYKIVNKVSMLELLQQLIKRNLSII